MIFAAYFVLITNFYQCNIWLVRIAFMSIQADADIKIDSIEKMCNYNGVCPISNGCGYWHLPYCCQSQQHLCMSCYNRRRLTSKPGTTTNISFLSKIAKTKNAIIDETDKKKIVCPRPTMNGVCRALYVAPCNALSSKTRKLHYPTGTPQRCHSRAVNTESIAHFEAAKSAKKNTVFEVARARRKSNLLKPKLKKNESETKEVNRPKSDDGGHWFQSAVPVHVNVPNLMVMPPDLMGNKMNAMSALSSSKTMTAQHNKLSAVPSNFQFQTYCGSPTMPIFCVYIERPQDALVAPKKTYNEIETQTPPTETNCLCRRKRMCKCCKRKSKRAINESTKFQHQETLSIPQKDDCMTQHSSSSNKIAACRTSAQSTAKHSVEFLDDSQECHIIKESSGKHSVFNSENNQSLRKKSCSHDSMVKGDLSDSYRKCKNLETRGNYSEAGRCMSFVSLYQQTKSNVKFGQRKNSQSVNHLPAIRLFQASENDTTAKSESKIRHDSISRKWQPVLRLIEDIVADKPSESTNTSITSKTPTTSRCTIAQQQHTVKESAKKKTRETASYFEGKKQRLASKMSNCPSCQFLSCEHYMPSFSCNEDRVKAALEKRPFVLVPYQMTAAHETIPVSESKHVFATVCNEESSKKVNERLHTTAILTPRPLSSDSNIRPPSYACSESNHHGTHNYEKTVLYETTTVCSLQNLIQPCSKPPQNCGGCALMAKQQFPHNKPLANQTMHSSQYTLHYHRSSEGASVRNDYSAGSHMSKSNSNQQSNVCPCCSSCCRCKAKPMMFLTRDRQVPIGFYQQTAQKYGIQIMDSFFRNHPTCENCCQMHCKQRHHFQKFATDSNAKRTCSSTGSNNGPFLKRTLTQKTLSLRICPGNKCPCLCSCGGHWFR